MNDLERIKRIYAGMLDGDVGALEEVLAPDVEWHPAEGNPTAPAAGGPIVGREAVVEDHDPAGKFARFWERLDCTPLRFHDGGEAIVVEARYVGRGLATGRELDAQACHVWTLRDGRVVRFRQYTDTAQLGWVLGLADRAGR